MSEHETILFVQVKYHGPTDTKGTRFGVSWETGDGVRRKFVSYDHSAHNAKVAAIAAVFRLPIVKGANDDGYSKPIEYSGTFGDATYYRVTLPGLPSDVLDALRKDAKR